MHSIILLSLLVSITNAFYYPRYPLYKNGIVCDRYGCISHKGCEEFCYRKQTYPYYTVNIVCCTLKGKSSL